MHREADQQRGKEYIKELQDMKERVSKRPYLFEQVKQVKHLGIHQMYICIQCEVNRYCTPLSQVVAVGCLKDNSGANEDICS